MYFVFVQNILAVGIETDNVSRYLHAKKVLKGQLPDFLKDFNF